MYAIIFSASIYITSAGCYFEDNPLGLVAPNLWPPIEEFVSFSKIYRLTLLDVNSPEAGLAAAIVDVLWSEKKAYCTIFYRKKSQLEAAFSKRHSSFAFQAS